MDIGKAITFITEDERYLEKLGIGVALLLISMVSSVAILGILGGFILAGYGVRLLKNVRDGVEKPLPEWDQWADDLGRGFKLAVVWFVWMLPLIVFAIPLVIGISILDSGGDAADVLGGSITFGTTCLMAIYGVFVAVMTPGFMIAFAKDESIRSGLQITEITRWTLKNIGQVVIAGLVGMAGSAVFGVAALISGLLLCGIGVILTLPLAGLASTLFQHHLYGQLAREFPANGERAETEMSIPNA